MLPSVDAALAEGLTALFNEGTEPDNLVALPPETRTLTRSMLTARRRVKAFLDERVALT